MSTQTYRKHRQVPSGVLSRAFHRMLRVSATPLRFPRRRASVGLLALTLGLFLNVNVALANYAQHPAAQMLIDELVAEHNFSREALNTLLSEAKKQQAILDAISRPAEKSKAWYEYRPIFLTERREREGVAFFLKHREALARAQAKTGVPAEVIVAIIGVETYYGRIAGSYQVLDALATLAFDYPPRSPFFTEELKNFFLLTREQKLDPLVLKGSYAGAMGLGQFMPSSYREYALDFDDDGVADIWNNPTDAIGSVANYLQRHGWREGGPVVSAASIESSTPESVFDERLEPRQTVAEFAANGVNAEQSLDGDAMASLMRFELEDGYEYWLGLHNLYVITRYNHSAMYAMSVYLLSQRIADGALL